MSQSRSTNGAWRSIYIVTAQSLFLYSN